MRPATSTDSTLTISSMISSFDWNPSDLKRLDSERVSARRATQSPQPYRWIGARNTCSMLSGA